MDIKITKAAVLKEKPDPSTLGFGKVFTDHLSAIRRQLIRGRLNNILSGRVSVDYPVRFAKPHRR